MHSDRNDQQGVLPWTTVRCYGTQALCSTKESASEFSTLTRGGNTFSTELTKNYRFSSSGLNLAFEGLLLGASHCFYVKGTHNEPRESGF
jgi:hypothetical protein